MRNYRPIFLFCFSRGGSNIFWNYFLTHPQACSPIRETLEIFRFDYKGLTWNGLKLSYLTRQPLFLNQKNLSQRRPISPGAQLFIDETLFEWKLKTGYDSEMRFKYEGTPYTQQEVEHARLVLKNNNGLIFLSDIFNAMYPNAVSFGLIRDPLALYESYLRRKFITSPTKFITFYRTIAGEMLHQAAKHEHFHLIRFEDILADPIKMLKRVYMQADLDFSVIRKVRLKAKAHLNDKGEHTSDFQVNSHHWLSLEELSSFISSDINKFQIANLTSQDRETIVNGLGDIMEQLGYNITNSALV